MAAFSDTAFGEDTAFGSTAFSFGTVIVVAAQSFAGVGPGIGGPRRVEPGAQRWEFQDPREIRVQAYRPQAPTPPRVDNKVGNFFAKPRTRKTRPLK